MTQPTGAPDDGDSQPQGRTSLFHGLEANIPVFFGSVILIFAVVLYGGFASEQAAAVFSTIQAGIIERFGWLYVLAVASFVVFVLIVGAGPMGRIRLGPDDSEPDFSYVSWFAMLFSAGMGIGIMFFGVAEPVLHFASPPTGEGETVDAARQAMEISFFHWGVHAWAIYAVMGLSLAYFAYRRGLPLTVRSALFPIIGDRIHGPIGDAVDIFAVVGTMFGVATSLGFGVTQVNAGLNFLFDIPLNVTTQIVLIAVITGFATASVVSGLNGGIRRISELNLYLALALLGFVLLVGPTEFLFRVLVQNVGDYLSDFVSNTFMLYAYRPEEGDWLGGWTLFYWGWWISWSPFVGMFIARVSRGRSIREFILGVLFVPSGFTFIWMTVFGNTAIDLAMMPGGERLIQMVQADVAVALFEFLAELPFTAISSGIATILVITFFVTSSDSGSLVIDTITSGGMDEPPVWQRIFWAVTEGLVAAVLLLAGGLGALQTAAITGALPLAIILLVVVYGLIVALRQDLVRQESLNSFIGTSGAHPTVPWRSRLTALVSRPNRSRARAFLRETVVPAFRAVSTELEAKGFSCEVESNDETAWISIAETEEDDGFYYAVEIKPYAPPSFALSGLEGKSDRGSHYYRAEVSLKEGGQKYDILGYTQDQVIADFIGQFERHLHFLHVAR